MNKPPNTVLITGASTGIGYGAARQFARRGYRVFAGVRTVADADRLRTELGPSVEPLLLDVTSEVSVQAAVQTLTSALAGSGLGYLINNAGVAIGGPLQHQPLAVIEQHLAVNVLGVVRITQAVLPLLGAGPSSSAAPDSTRPGLTRLGRILMISSVNGQVAIPFMGAYVASKHALEGLSHSWRRELAPFGIRVIIVGPGAVKTPIWGKGTDISPYSHTPYYPAMQRFMKRVRAAEAGGLTADAVGERLVQIAEAPRPRIRYALLPQPVVGWLIPRLPNRLLDWVLARI
ncbi:SDR family oxidoreductase [Spirosoma luteolum]